MGEDDDELGRAIEDAPEPAAPVPSLGREAELPVGKSVAEERAAVERADDAPG